MVNYKKKVVNMNLQEIDFTSLQNKINLNQG